MKIIQISDVHLVADNGDLFGENPAERLSLCIADIQQHHSDAALCVLTGDLTHAGEAGAYRRLASLLCGLSMPVRILMGNHDDRAVFREAFPHTPVDSDGFVQSVLDGEAGRMIFLDTLEPGTPAGRLCETRLRWLDRMLMGADGRPVYLFMHHPPFDIAFPSMDWIGLADADAQALHRTLKRYSNVEHIFAGHVHRPCAGHWHGIGFSTTRGTHHQHELDMDRAEGYATTIMEPPGYVVAQLRDSGIVVHFHDFLDKPRRYPYIAK